MNARTYGNIFYKGSEYNLLHSDLQDGKIKVATDTARIFVDFTGIGRIEFTDFVRGYTSTVIEDNIIENPITSKIYIASDTGHLYVYLGSSFVDITNLKVTSAYSADSATYATSAGSADTATTATSATSAANATFATNAGSAASATTAINATFATKDASGNIISSTYAPINSPTFTGAPKVPTAATSDDSTNIANTAFVKAAIAAALSGITHIDIVYTDELPETGQPYTLYFIPDESGTSCTEYMWIDNRWEVIGSTTVDSGIAGIRISGTGNAFTNASVDSNGLLQITKDSTFLTQHPAIATTADTTTSQQYNWGGSVAAISAITRDANGHVTTSETTSYTMEVPDSISASTVLGGWDFNFGELPGTII